MAASLIVLAFYLYTVYAIIGKQKKLGKGAAKPISRPPASAMHAMRLKVPEIMRHPTCKARPHNADSKRHDAYWNARPPALTLPLTASALARETTTAPAPPRRTAASVPSHARRWRHEHDVAALSIKGARAVLNFPDLASHLPRPASLAPRDVQAAAARAALMHSAAGSGGSSSPSSSSSSSSRDAQAAPADDDSQQRAGAAAHDEPEPEPQPERQLAQVEVAAELVFDELAPLWVEDVVEFGPSDHTWTPCDGLDAAVGFLHPLPLLWDY